MVTWLALGILCSALLLGGAEKCCSNGDCYDKTHPFNTMWVPLPDCPDEIEPTYKLYTRDTRDNPHRIDRNNIPKSFDKSRTTAFIIHGYRHDGTQHWMAETMAAMLDRDDLNVIIVGWGKGADILNYMKAVANTRMMGMEISHIMANLVQNGGASLDKMWCVGHSLGAHICGRAGKEQKYGNITGLDPAGPTWDDLAVEAGLTKDDADFVDNIHTHGQELVPFGTLKARGHVDFYPNRAAIQPGCLTYDANRIANNPLMLRRFFGGAQRLDVSCSHSRAYEFFIESVKNSCFFAVSKCTDPKKIPVGCTTCGDNCPLMGYGTEAKEGIYYLQTRGSRPFCKLGY